MKNIETVDSFLCGYLYIQFFYMGPWETRKSEDGEQREIQFCVECEIFFTQRVMVWDAISSGISIS